MPKASEDLLSALWHATDRAAAVEHELQVASEELAAWRAIAEAAMRALDREITRRNAEPNTAATIA
jgi:hypothetical protein